MSTTDDIVFDGLPAVSDRIEAVLAGLDTLDRRYISATQINQYQRCPRQWSYRYVLGIKAPPASALITGRGVHEAAELGMIRKLETGDNPDPEQVKTDAADAINAMVETEDIVYDDDTPATLTDKAVRMSEAWAIEAAPHVTPVEVETEFTVDMAGIPVTGRLDVVTPTVVVDWKTKSRNKPNRGEVVASVQTELYARATGKPVTYVYLVNQVKCVQVVDVEVGPEEAAQAARLAEATVADVAEGMALGVWPRNRNGWHCSAKTCGYYERCLSGRDDRDLSDKAAEARGAAGVMW